MVGHVGVFYSAGFGSNDVGDFARFVSFKSKQLVLAATSVAVLAAQVDVIVARVTRWLRLHLEAARRAWFMAMAMGTMCSRHAHPTARQPHLPR